MKAKNELLFYRSKRVGVTYDPLETHPSWYDVSTVQTSNLYITGSDIYTRNTNSEMLLSYKNAQFVDVEVSSIIRYEGTTTGTSTFTMVVRAIDVNNFIGIRSYNNEIQVFERIGGAFTILDIGSISNSNTTDKKVILKVVGATVTLDIDGVDYPINDTTLLSTGYIGILQRVWNIGTSQLVSNFAYRSFD